FFFFFQAEDGIRDIGVTGVQTCALPIWITLHDFAEQPCDALVTAALTDIQRSEERRVGKSVDLGGRRIIKKKKNKQQRRQFHYREEKSDLDISLYLENFY